MFIFFWLILLPPRSTLFPCTTLFRSQNGTTLTVSGPDGTDTLTRIEKLTFSDVSIQSSLDSGQRVGTIRDRKSTRLNSSHRCISYAVFCLKKKRTSATLNYQCCTPIA